VAARTVIVEMLTPTAESLTSEVTDCLSKLGISFEPPLEDTSIVTDGWTSAALIDCKWITEPSTISDACVEYIGIPAVATANINITVVSLDMADACSLFLSARCSIVVC
jgi:hypothetical protein